MRKATHVLMPGFFKIIKSCLISGYVVVILVSLFFLQSSIDQNPHAYVLVETSETSETSVVNQLKENRLNASFIAVGEMPSGTISEIEQINYLIYSSGRSIDYGLSDQFIQLNIIDASCILKTRFNILMLNS